MANMAAEYTTMFGELVRVSHHDGAFYASIDGGTEVKVSDVTGERPVYIAERLDPLDGALQVGWFGDDGVQVLKTTEDTGATWA